MLREKYNSENLRAYLYYTGNKEGTYGGDKIRKSKIKQTISNFEDTVKILNREFDKKRVFRRKMQRMWI